MIGHHFSGNSLSRWGSIDSFQFKKFLSSTYTMQNKNVTIWHPEKEKKRSYYTDILFLMNSMSN